MEIDTLVFTNLRQSELTRKPSTSEFQFATRNWKVFVAAKPLQHQKTAIINFMHFLNQSILHKFA